MNDYFSKIESGTINSFRSTVMELHKLIVDLADQYGRSRESLLPILQGVVERENYLSKRSMAEISKELDLPAAEVYGTATFYSFLEFRKMGKYTIRVCKTISCSMKGKNQILWAIKDMLKIDIGQTTPDGRFSLVETNCLGWCHKAPAMVINHEVFTELTPEKVRDILGDYLKKEL